MTRAARRERGQASVLLVGALLVGLAFAGLAIDGARLFTARRDLQNLADAAALAGASELDEAAYRATGGAVARLDPGAARAAAERNLAGSSLPAGTQVTIEATPERVVVRLSRAAPTTFLRIVGMRVQTLGATATAGPRTG